MAINVHSTCQIFRFIILTKTSDNTFVILVIFELSRRFGDYRFLEHAMSDKTNSCLCHYVLSA